MAITYRQSQADSFATPSVSVAIEDDAWWGGVQKCFAGIALSAVLVSTAIAQNVQEYDKDEIPAGFLFNAAANSFQPVRQFSINPSRYTVRYAAPDSDDLPVQAATSIPTEDFWQNPVAPVAASIRGALPLGDQDDVLPVTPAAASVEEDVWLNPVLPVQSVNHVLFPLGDPEEIPAASLYGQPDEDLWRNPVQPVAASLSWPQQWAFDIQESAGSLFGQYDEDFWRSGVAPVWWTNLYPQQSGFDSQEPAGSLFGQFDEDFWRNPVAPSAASLYRSPLLGDQEEIPGALLFGQPPEEYWQNPTRPVAASLYQSLPYFFDPAEFLPTIQPQFDEDFWFNPVAPVQATLYRTPVCRDVEEVPAGSLLKSQAVDEYYWQNWTRPVVASLYQQFPYAFDSGELNAPAQSGTAQPAGLSLVAAENDPTASAQVPGGGKRRPGRMYPMPVPTKQNFIAIAHPQGIGVAVGIGKVTASGSAQASVQSIPSIVINVGTPKAKGIRNLTDEELMTILMGL